jgi:hypothetical protein
MSIVQAFSFPPRIDAITLDESTEALSSSVFFSCFFLLFFSCFYPSCLPVVFLAFSITTIYISHSQEAIMMMISYVTLYCIWYYHIY